MSLKNLIPYIKSKKCEILGLYSEKSVLSFLKLFHMPSKSFFFLNVAYHKINLSVPFENITSDEIYRIGEYEEDFTEELILYFQVLESHLTKHLSNIIFFTCFIRSQRISIKPGLEPVLLDLEKLFLLPE